MKGKPTPVFNRHFLWCFSMCYFISFTSQPFKEALLRFHFKDEESGTLWQLSDFSFNACGWEITEFKKPKLSFNSHL